MPAGSNKEPPPSSTEPDNGQDSSNNDSKNLTPLVKHFLAYRTINARDWDEWCLRRCAKPSRPEHEAECSRLCLRRTWATSAQEKDKDTQNAQLCGEQATQYRSWNPLKGYSIVSGPYPVKETMSADDKKEVDYQVDLAEQLERLYRGAERIAKVSKEGIDFYRESWSDGSQTAFFRKAYETATNSWHLETLRNHANKTLDTLYKGLKTRIQNDNNSSNNNNNHNHNNNNNNKKQQEDDKNDNKGDKK